MKTASNGPSRGKKYTSGTLPRILRMTRNVFPCFAQEMRRVLGRAAMRASTSPSCSMTTKNSLESRRATISFTERFWALVSASSANDGVKIVIIRM